MDYQTLLRYIAIVGVAHQEKPNKHGNPLRSFPGGRENPYFTHPVWCALMMFLEPLLPDEVRIPGSLALLFHDVIEDTTTPLPEDLPRDVKRLVDALTVPKLPEYNYSGWELEKETILEKPRLIQLLKLYDKTSSLYDMSVREDRYQEWMTITGQLAKQVEEEFGRLNIVILAQSLIAEYRRRGVGA